MKLVQVGIAYIEDEHGLYEVRVTPLYFRFLANRATLSETEVEIAGERVAVVKAITPTGTVVVQPLR